MPIPASSILHTASGAHALDLRLADTFFTRLRGLMLAAPLHGAQGLLITRCASVHAACMRYPIDVVYLDRHGVVTRCAAGLRPWRASFGGLGWRAPRTAHTLELAAGAIAALHIRPGDRLRHPRLEAVPATVAGMRDKAERGSAMIEFTVVGPIITLLGLSILQYGMLFFARTQINYAAFMAAREGAVAHASVSSAYAAYTRALIPLYGGGQTPAQLAASLAKANADLGANGSGNASIELLNPTRQSFDDWNDVHRQIALHTGNRRVIPYSGQNLKEQKVGATSGQTIQDANLIKLRITHGYLPKVPLVKNLYATYLKWLDPHTDAFHTKLLASGRIPVVTHVTVHMQSDAIEGNSLVSAPGPGNGGTPVNPGDPPVTSVPPPACDNLSCTDPPVTPPACNPFTDPQHCVPEPCTVICCTPS